MDTIFKLNRAVGGETARAREIPSQRTRPPAETLLVNEKKLLSLAEYAGATSAAMSSWYGNTAE